MNYILLLLIVSILVFSASPVVAQDALEVADPESRRTVFRLDPSVSVSFGHSTYRMDILQPSAPSGEISYLASELEFPLDHIMGGMAVHVQSYLDVTRDWEFVVSGFTNFNAPAGTMYDSDWMTVVNGFDGQFSYTESDPDGSSLIIDGEFSKRITGDSRASWGGLGGFRYQKITQDIDNFTGWQIDDAGNRIEFDVSGVPALDYEVTYGMPRLGLYGLFSSGQNFQAEFDISGMAVFASDDDDHLLRNKRATGDGTGYGVVARAEADYALAQHRSGAQPFLGLRAEVLSLKVDGDQTQRWYDDETILVRDPNTGEVTEEVLVPAGTSFSDIPHEVTSTQFQVGIRLGFTF